MVAMEPSPPYIDTMGMSAVYEVRVVIVLCGVMMYVILEIDCMFMRTTCVAMVAIRRVLYLDRVLMRVPFVDMSAT